MLVQNLDEDTQLRLLMPHHAGVLLTAMNANRERLYWMDSEYTLERASEFVRKGLQMLMDGVGFSMGIWYRNDFVGLVGLSHVSRRTRSGELGYWLISEAEGKGLATRSCAAMIDYAFTEYGLRRIAVRIARSNAKSCAIPERLGFTMEGTARAAEPVGDRWEDLLVYGLLAEEWTSEP